MRKGKNLQFPTPHHVDDGPYDAILANRNEHTCLSKCIIHSLQCISISCMPSIHTSHLASMTICWVTFSCIVSLGSSLWIKSSQNMIENVNTGNSTPECSP